MYQFFVVFFFKYGFFTASHISIQCFSSRSTVSLRHLVYQFKVYLFIGLFPYCISCINSLLFFFKCGFFTASHISIQCFSSRSTVSLRHLVYQFKVYLFIGLFPYCISCINSLLFFFFKYGFFTASHISI